MFGSILVGKALDAAYGPAAGFLGACLAGTAMHAAYETLRDRSAEPLPSPADQEAPGMVSTAIAASKAALPQIVSLESGIRLLNGLHSAMGGSLLAWVPTVILGVPANLILSAGIRSVFSYDDLKMR
jgi:hypothetical protein